ncbi:MAG: helix-turn-helix transcriptional regulator [Candidatus Omnitrophota bacterium]|jgi:transcriptional regulator with XRE-family HTH domain
MDKKSEDSLEREPIIKNRLRYCRMAISLSQKDVAFLMELPVSQISRWERGKRIPSVYNAIGLAVAAQRLVEDVFFDYRGEWRERIKERAKLLNPEDKKVEKLKNKKHDRYTQR